MYSRGGTKTFQGAFESQTKNSITPDGTNVSRGWRTGLNSEEGGITRFGQLAAAGAAIEARGGWQNTNRNKDRRR